LNQWISFLLNSQQCQEHWSTNEVNSVDFIFIIIVIYW